MNPDYENLVRALQYLSSVCDGAQAHLEQKRIVVDNVTDGQAGDLQFSIFGELVKEIVKLP